MKVWLPQDVKAAKPSAPATLAAQAKVEFSSPVPAKSSITDGLVPADENDRSVPYIHWWPKKNTTEWITYTFPESKEIKTSTVYWYDDQPWGGCKVPNSWKLYYQDEAGNWKEVPGADAYPCKRGVACIVNFDPVKTKAVKLELKQPETLSCGLFEWSVK
jgi:F5/8 type C domain.